MSDDFILFCSAEEDEEFAEGFLDWFSRLGIADIHKFSAEQLPNASVVIALMPIMGAQVSDLIEELKLAHRRQMAVIGVLMPEVSRANLTKVTPYIDYLASETIYSTVTESLAEHLSQFYTIGPEIFVTQEGLPSLQKPGPKAERPTPEQKPVSKSPRRPFLETKLIVVGEGSVGKTSLINRILGVNYSPEESMTDGIAIRNWSVKVSNNRDLTHNPNGTINLPVGPRDMKVTEDETVVVESEVEVRVHIWDFGGQEIMRATHQFFLTERCLYLLVVDARLTPEENRVEYWLKIIQSLGGGSPVIVVGNKIDQQRLYIDGTTLQREHQNVVAILETSAARNEGIGDLILTIKQQMGQMRHVWRMFSEECFRVRSKLEQLEKERDFITLDQYSELCAENNLTDENEGEALIRFLHDLGAVLHFKEDSRLESLGILNPQWVTDGVYKIINCPELSQNKGVLERAMLDNILNLPQYPASKRLFIVNIMLKFELCYEIETDQKFLIPSLLPVSEPPDLKFGGVPAFEYLYPFLPPNVINRFIVRMSQKIHAGTVWCTGVLLTIEESTVLVRADFDDRKIKIAIGGLERRRRDALAAVRYQLDDINTALKGLPAKKRVPIPDVPNAEPLDYDFLLQLEQEGTETVPVWDGGRRVDVNIRQLLSGVASEDRRRDEARKITNIYIGGNVINSTIIAGDENETRQVSSSSETSEENHTNKKDKEL